MSLTYPTNISNHIDDAAARVRAAESDLAALRRCYSKKSLTYSRAEVKKYKLKVRLAYEAWLDLVVSWISTKEENTTDYYEEDYDEDDDMSCCSWDSEARPCRLVLIPKTWVTAQSGYYNNNSIEAPQMAGSAGAL